ncbi:hypothetical protein ABT160_28525 [Streptomyces sp. NPDC001941]|uniref:hypothetical protein n=1 Tax=Streptomyces sp. NPDC001941 TaxID=3154659 RepID=UPI0033309E25
MTSQPVLPRLTAAAPPPQISKSHRPLAKAYARGLPLARIAREAGLSRSSLARCLAQMREQMHCPPGASRAVLVHALLTHQQVPRPSTPRPDLILTVDEVRLLRAISEHSTHQSICNATGLSSRRRRNATRALLAKTGAVDSTHLVVIGHAMGILRPQDGRPAATPPPAGAAPESTS